ncbi:unnamed protein product [Polarella glacialis]|uniref:Uncharacterized protein n=1 Tax=Polarella glacialis TaxID=89957 RepID=A0A813DC43_POLGL|nr:unnamed protein product [Polarella glacialis]CAE8647372.1 unnamed protein product [Polarella glacialis]
MASSSREKTTRKRRAEDAKRLCLQVVDLWDDERILFVTVLEPRCPPAPLPPCEMRRWLGYSAPLKTGLGVSPISLSPSYQFCQSPCSQELKRSSRMAFVVWYVAK